MMAVTSDGGLQKGIIGWNGDTIARVKMILKWEGTAEKRIRKERSKTR
jgi:hypothetical protein